MAVGTGASGRLTQVCRLTGHEERVWSVAWRPNASPPQLASCGEDRAVRVWGQRPRTEMDAEASWVLLAELDTKELHSRTIRSVSWSPSGSVLACASFDATTTLWHEVPESEREEAGQLEFKNVGTVSGHENEVKCAAFSASGEYMATCSRDKSVWIFDTDEQHNFEYECLSLLQSHTQDVKSLRWHPEQDVLFSCSYDDTVKVWGPDGDDWSCKETLAGHESTVWSLVFDATGSRFATCSDDRSVRIWGPADQVEAPVDDSSAKEKLKKSLAALPQNLHLAAVAFVAPLFRSGDLLGRIGAIAEEASTSAPAPAARRTPADASCSWRCLGKLGQDHPRPVYSVDWLPFGVAGHQDVVATACGDNHVRVFEPCDASLREWVCKAEVEAHLGDANCVAWCPQALPSDGGVLLATAGDDAEIALWRYSP